MAHCHSSLVVSTLGLAVLALAASAWAQFHEPQGQTPKQPASASPVLILSARRLATLRKTGIALPTKGTWHVWAWQRAGVKVLWKIADREADVVQTPKRLGGAFSWARLGTINAQAGKPLAFRFTPSSAKPKDAAVAALALARDASFDPAKLWNVARVFPYSPEAVEDKRPGQCRHLNLRYTMPVYKTKKAWETRAAWLREHIRVSSGLIPEPERTPLKPRVFDKVERDGYTIEKAFIESRPGFYCTGNLYRPRGPKGPFPAIACPHGHWSQGRFGHEPPKGSAPGRFITLARLGYVVFAYDMVGYNDSGRQTGGHRGVFTTPHNELWGLSMMHLQSWNTLRAIDFLQSLPDVIPDRIAVTGCSGGGTQTFMVMGIDPRVTVAAPVNMISGIMQGGCECENSPLLRITTNNIEIGALMAPRPLIMCSVTGDWTRETPKSEYPGVRSAYELHKVADRVINVHDKAPHGYNKVHRQAVYTFFRRWLKGIDDGKKIVEPPFTPEKKQDLLVFGKRPLPKDAKNAATLKKHVIAECRRQRDELLPRKPADLERFRGTLGVAYRHAILASLPKPAELSAKKLGATPAGDAEIIRLLLGRKGVGDQVPALLFRPKAIKGKAPANIIVHPLGKAALIDPATGHPNRLIDSLLAHEQMVLAIDPYLTGEHHTPFAVTRQKKIGKFFSTYNRTLIVQRIQDVLTALAYLDKRPDVSVISLVGLEEAGAWCLLAAPFAPEGTRIVADLHQLAGDDDPRWLGDLFTPCILKAGALWTAVALAAPRPLFLHNIADTLATAPLRPAYQAAQSPKSLRVEPRRCQHLAIARWLRQTQ